MRIYGVTGGTGSGKSEACRRFAELGFPVFDADKVGHEVIAPGGPGEEAVIAALGNDIVTDGRIDRAKLGARIFSDPAARATLNAIVHPLIQAEIMHRIAALAEAGHMIAIIDAALLAEDGRKESWLTGLVLVLSSRELRLRRLVDDKGLTPQQAKQRIDAQLPPEKKLALADHVIQNDDSVEDLHSKVEAIAKEWRDHGPRTAEVSPVRNIHQ